MKRTLTIFALASAAVVASALPASAHVELQPSSAAVGTTTKFNLFVEDEKSDAGTTKVELFFPKDTTLVVVAATAPDGWTVSAVGGSIGAAATGLTWAGPALDGNANLALTLGPLPTTEASMQFSLLQTYDNGDIDRWIGAAGAENPGPNLQILAAGATTTTGEGAHDDGNGSHHATDTTVADHHGSEGTDDPGHHDAETTSSKAPTTTTAAAPAKDDSSNAPAIIGVIVAALVLGGGVAFAAKSRKKP